MAFRFRRLLCVILAVGMSFFSLPVNAEKTDVRKLPAAAGTIHRKRIGSSRMMIQSRAIRPVAATVAGTFTNRESKGSF